MSYGRIDEESAGLTSGSRLSGRAGSNCISSCTARASESLTDEGGDDTNVERRPVVEIGLVGSNECLLGAAIQPELE
jgi:hypothetical protein